MIELGQLEKAHAEFAKRNLQVVAASIEDVETAAKSQAQFPHLRIVSDVDRSLTNAVAGIHVGAHPDGGDAAAPTTYLIDLEGRVKWYFRPTRHLKRLSVDEILTAIDAKTSP